jgi:RNA polymerase sigma-70 factor (ECF subfamily)
MSQSQPASQYSANGSTSHTLLGRLQAHDEAAWDRLVKLYAPLVYHWCRQQGLPDGEMGDVFQDVFQAVAANIGRFRKDRGGDTFRGWLRTITRHKVADHFRKRSIQPQATGGTSAFQQISRVPAPADSDSEPAADAVAHRELIQRGLELIRGEFAPHTWQAFWQMAVENRSAAEIAQQLSMSAGAVRVAKCRVLRRLREELGDIT